MKLRECAIISLVISVFVFTFGVLPLCLYRLTYLHADRVDESHIFIEAPTVLFAFFIIILLSLLNQR